MAYEDHKSRMIRSPLKPLDQHKHPDRRWSDSDYWFLDRGRETIMLMEVKGLGVLRMRATGGHDDGKLRFEGVALTTTDEIQKGEIVDVEYRDSGGHVPGEDDGGVL